MVNHLVQNCADATSVKFVNCDAQGCELMEATHNYDGTWSFNSQGPASPDMWQQRTDVVMMEMDFMGE